MNFLMRPRVQVLDLGRLAYGPTLQIQKHCIQRHLDLRTLVPGQPQGTNRFKGPYPNTLILVEHNPVYTIGIRTKDYTIKDEEDLLAKGAEFYKTDRGGLITFHGPGQLVAYPIIHLQEFGLGLRKYVGQLESTLVRTCAEFGVKAGVTDDVGVWVEDRKVAALGIHAKRYVTSHGIALNCDVDLQWFKHIVPCGITDKGVTSLSRETSLSVSIATTIPKFLDCFAKEFNCELDMSTLKDGMPNCDLHIENIGKPR